jgi:hypothetical protein
LGGRGLTRGYQPDFDIDRQYGDEGEGTVRRALDLSDKRIDVKRKRYADDKFYVELEHDPGARGQFRPSGLTRTRADYFAYVIADTGIIVLFPTEVLRRRIAR